MKFQIYFKVLLLSIIFFSLTFSFDKVSEKSLSIKSINYFSNIKEKELFYDYFVHLNIPTKYDSLEVYHSVRRLEELNQIKSVKLIEEIVNDSVILNYYIHEYSTFIFEPYGGFLQKPDTLLNQAYATCKVTLTNPFYNNNNFYVDITHYLPFGYSNIPQIIKGFDYKKATFGYYNEFFTKYFFTSGIYGNYTFVSSATVLGIDERFMSVNFSLGKRVKLNSFTAEYAYYDAKSFKDNSEATLLSHNRYPRISLRWMYDKKSSERYYSNRTMLKLQFQKYGYGDLDSLGVDFLKLNTEMKYITTYNDFKFSSNVYFSKLFMVDMISPTQKLFAGGQTTNRGYYPNSLPLLNASDSVLVGVNSYNGIQTELSYFVYRFGPIKNFFLNHLSSFWGAAIWFDYTSVTLPTNDVKSYYSYGAGIRLFANKINTYWTIDYSLNKENKSMISLYNGINF